MRAIDPALCKALALSVLLHALLFAAGGRLDDPFRRSVAAPEAQFDVTLRPREAAAPMQPPLFLREPPQSAAVQIDPAREPAVRMARAIDVMRSRPNAESGHALAGEAAQQASAQLAKELFYPPEAVLRGLQGEALVLLFLDASGNAIAARLEASSGHALLDDAAVRAARTLRSLPDSAPREALLPVRFRLR
jgi:protein TonB